MPPVITKTNDRLSEVPRTSDQNDEVIALRSRGSLGRIDVSVNWFQRAEEKLKRILELPTGWDSHGAAPPKKENVLSAHNLLQCLYGAGNLPEPQINPTRAGGVQFEWEEGSRYFELEVVAERAAEYFFQDTGIEESGEVFEVESLDEVIRYIRRVAAN